MNIFKQLWDKVRLPTPVELGKSKHNSLPMRDITPDVRGYTWEDYNIDIRILYPIRNFLFNTFSFWFKAKFIWPIKRGWYWFKHRVVLRTHMLDLRQPKDGCDGYRHGYCDPRQCVLYACFNSLVMLVEKEYGGVENIILEDDNEFAVDWNHARSEMKELYFYWTIGRHKEQKATHALYDAYIADSLHLKSLREEWLKAEDAREKHEQEMLVRLVKIREYMWT